MEEKVPELTTQPTVPNNTPPNPEMGEKSHTLWVVVGVVIIIVIFAVAVFVLSYSNQPTESTTTTTATDSAAINSTSDLEKVSDELDKTDLDSYETELDQNDTDAADF